MSLGPNQVAIKTLKLTNENYPPLLKQIADPPATLYCRGNLETLRRPSVAIVGSRNATAYGKKHAQIIGSDIARAGFSIVSGLAYGVDSWAHEAAVDYGQAIGVVAGGLSYPLLSWQKQLAKNILETGGLLVSEFPGETPALKHHFPLRNRIIAGLSYGTVVIEARLKSGALITAKAALESNRSVMALPGDVDRETSGGSLELIRQGALLVRNSLDIKNELINQLPKTLVTGLPNDTERDIMDCLEGNPKAPEEIARALKRPINDVTMDLSKLEIDGQILRLANNTYTLKI